MIDVLLNRDFVMDQMRQVRKNLALPPEERRRGSAIPQEAKELKIGEDDRQAALAELEKSLAAEATDASGQTPKFPTSGGETPLDDWAFISSDPVISNLQTVLEYYLTDGPGKTKNEVQLAAPAVSERRGPGNTSLIANATLKGFTPRAADGRRLFNKFSVTDPEWVSTGLAVGMRWLRGRHDFVTEAPVVKMADNARIVMVGDWGSGIERAQKVAVQMRKYIDEGAAERREVHVVHLGDVYYSGWRREYERRFLPYWPVKPGEEDRISSWCLNGNHDMYSGGHGYFNFLLKDPRFKKQNGASFFCLENGAWKIFGLDTAHEDGGLREPQGDWIKARLDSSKNTMFLTHHQPFSLYEKAAQKMNDKLQPVFGAAGKIKSWFWGHEHRFMLFKDHDCVEFGRLLGNGGVPVYMNRPDNNTYTPPEVFEDRRFIPKTLGLEHWAYFGFAVLDFDGAQISARYFDEEGQPSYQKTDVIG